MTEQERQIRDILERLSFETGRNPVTYFETAVQALLALTAPTPNADEVIARLIARVASSPVVIDLLADMIEWGAEGDGVPEDAEGFERAMEILGAEICSDGVILTYPAPVKAILDARRDRRRAAVKRKPYEAPAVVATKCLLWTAGAPEENCAACRGTGMIETGNNDLPCHCPAGDTAEFNVSGRGRMTGAQIKAER